MWWSSSVGDRMEDLCLRWELSRGRFMSGSIVFVIELNVCTLSCMTSIHMETLPSPQVNNWQIENQPWMVTRSVLVNFASITAPSCSTTSVEIAMYVLDHSSTLLRLSWFCVINLYLLILRQRCHSAWCWCCDPSLQDCRHPKEFMEIRVLYLLITSDLYCLSHPWSNAMDFTAATRVYPHPSCSISMIAFTLDHQSRFLSKFRLTFQWRCSPNAGS